MRKNPEADLRRNYRKLIEIGMISSLSFVLLLFMAFRQVEMHPENVEIPDQLIEVEEIPPTEQIKRPPPPARPSIPIPTEDEDIPEDETIDETEIDFDDIPPPPEAPPEDESSNVFVAYDEAPQPIGGIAAIQRKLKYPEIARKAGIEGKVIVNILVDEKGKVIDARVLKSVGHAGMDKAAIEALKSVRWRPAKQRDKPVKVWVGFPVVFKLK